VLEEGPAHDLSYLEARNGPYEGELTVIAQMAPHEDRVRFEAESVNGQWVFGQRVADA
jgi:hypothetical protein